jgi:hypothetical protein
MRVFFISYGSTIQVIQTVIDPALIELRLSIVLVRARIRFVPANETMGVVGSATEKLVLETAAVMSKGALTQAVSVPVIPSVAVRVVVPVKAVPVLTVHERTVALAGSARRVTL